MKAVNRERGFVVIIFASVIFVLIFVFAGLAIDVTKAYSVKAQLQNAADACALAGARNLYPCSLPFTPNWTTAESAARAFLGRNEADNKQLRDAIVESGWWNRVTLAFLPNSGLQGANDEPAVRVTIAKSPGSNDGPVQTLFARMVGWQQFEVRARAVAAIARPQGIFPFVIGQCLVNDTMNGIRSNVDFVLDNTIYGGSQAGQWTSLTNSNAGANQIASYIRYLADPSDSQASPPPVVQFGTFVNIQGGVLNALYQPAQDLVLAGNSKVVMPVVACPVPTNGLVPVVDFVAVQLTGATTGTNPSISGHLFPPKLVQQLPP